MELVPIELAKNRGWSLLQRLDKALGAGEIHEARWYADVAAVITPAYLAANNPRPVWLRQYGDGVGPQARPDRRGGGP